jgi:hypothetical protein
MHKIQIKLIFGGKKIEDERKFCPYIDAIERFKRILRVDECTA